MKSQDGFPRILHLRKRKKSGATLSEEVIAEVANIASVTSGKQVLEALIFDVGNKDLAPARLFATSPSSAL